MVQWIVQDMLLMPLVHFLAIPGMIWLDHSLELVFLFQDGVETWLSAKVTAIIFSSNYPPIGTSGPFIIQATGTIMYA